MEGLIFESLSWMVPDYYEQKNRVERRLGRHLSNNEFERDYLDLRGGVVIERHRD